MKHYLLQCDSKETSKVSNTLPALSKLETIHLIPEARLEPDIKVSRSVLRKLNESVDTSRLDKIEPHSIILAQGRSSIAITRDANFTPSSFLVPEMCSFYHPKLQALVFPIFEKTVRKSPPFGYMMNLFNLQVQRALSIEVFPDRKFLDPSWTILNSMDQVNIQNQIITIDLETTGLNARRDSITYFSFAADVNTGYVINWKGNEQAIINFILQNKIVGQNIKFDLIFLHENGLDLSRVDLVWDTRNGAHVINETQPSSLSFQSWIYSEMGGYDYEVKSLFKTNDDLMSSNDLGMHNLDLYKYAAYDALSTYRAYVCQKNILDQNDKLFRYFTGIVVPTVMAFAKIEKNGIMVSDSKIQKTRDSIYKDMNILGEEIRKFFDQPDCDFIRSPKKLSDLFEKHGVDTGERTPSGQMKTGAAELTQLSRSGFEIAGKIAEYKSLYSLANSFMTRRGAEKGLGQYIESNSRIYPIFNIMTAQSHRFTSSNPNLQNIPKNKIIRDAFIQTPGYYLCEFDASGLQLRIVAAQSNDPIMKKAFMNNEDLHSRTAYEMFANEYSFAEYEEALKLGNDEDKKTWATMKAGGDDAQYHRYMRLADKAKYYRQIGKCSNFSLVFNGGAHSFAIQLKAVWDANALKLFCEQNGIKQTTMEEDYIKSAQFLIKKFFNSYKGIKQWIMNRKKMTSKDYFIYSPYGARRYILENKFGCETTDAKKMKHAWNIACNTTVQSSEVCIVCLAILRILHHIETCNLKSRILGMIHDSVVVEIKIEEFAIMRKIIFDAFEYPNPEDNEVPIKGELNVADTEKGDIWGFGKVYTKR